VAAMRKVARLVPGAQSVIERVARRDYSIPGKPDIDWGDAEANAILVSDLVNEALALVAGLAGHQQHGRILSSGVHPTTKPPTHPTVSLSNDVYHPESMYTGLKLNHSFVLVGF
jgi:hypothetical protein